MFYTKRAISIASAILGLTACASAPNWQHTRITDKMAAARQLVIDDGNCTLISTGAAPIPEIPASNSPQTTNITLRGSTYNTTTGARSNSTYTGQATTAPSGGFAGGFASGMQSGAAIGAAIAARNAQDNIHKSCMYSKGWTDAVPEPTSDAGLTKTAKVASAKNARAPAAHAEIYASAQAEWEADTAEFMVFFPAYKGGDYFDRLNQKVKALAAAKAMTGPQYLLAALKQLNDEGRDAPLPTGDEGGYRTMYIRSVDGDIRAQSSLGLAYVQGDDPRVPIDYKRSAHWSRKSALAGSLVGQLGYGILLFRGDDIQPDRINGYLWMKKAAQGGLDVSATLNRFEAEMSAAELQAVK